MQKINEENCPRSDRTESEGYVGMPTFMEIKDEEFVEVQLEENYFVFLLLD